MKKDLREILKNRLVIGDGAMGTYLYQLGFPVGISYEELNLTKPEVIADVHRKYYEAGARLIETNTFTANREKLSKYGLDQEVKAINREAVRIARQSVGADAFVVGAVGSIRAGRKKDYSLNEIATIFREQIAVLLEEGVDGIVLETFYDLEEMLAALRVVREMSDLPVIGQFAAEDSGRTSDGVEFAEAFRRITEEGADVVGFNCRSGPKTMIRCLERLNGLGLAYSVFPNAGIPDYIDGEYTFITSPDYFSRSALRFAELGAKIMGGCCGTTPDHIKAMAEALKDFEPQKTENDTSLSAADANNGRARVVIREPERQLRPVRPQPETLLDLVEKRHTVIVELDPPKDLSIDRFMEGAKALRDAGADALTMADNSLAVTRMSNMALGAIVKDRLGIRPLIHIACRDRNLIGTQSHLMGLDALGIDHVLAVTGDPARFGDLPGSSSVYDMTSFEMIRMIKQLNEGIAFSGKPLKQKARFVVGAAFNPNVRHLDKAVRRLERKVEAGADFIMTQPVYDPVLIERISEATRHIGVPIFIGIFPLASGNNAEFLHNEVPGIKLSDEIRRRMSGLRGAEGRAMGVQIAKELLDVALQYFNGIYLMTPFLAYEMTVELTEYVWSRTRRDFHLFPQSK